jgi:hypothetical protein
MTADERRATRAATYAASARAAADGARAPRGPVIVLTYPHSGAEMLTHALSASRSLACTSGTGLVPLCHVAAAVWRQAEGHGASSALAITSIRTLANTMITVILAQAGAARWCETAFGHPAAAVTFLEVFPDATFVCLHRSLPGVLADGSAAYPWGLGDSPFWPYSAAHPGNNAATIAAYWAASTEPLLAFEAQHARSCLRVRNEDLAADPDRHVARIYLRLGLDIRDLHALPQPRHDREMDHLAVHPNLLAPADKIPAELLAKINELHSELGYAPLA